jgi:hypothetical protein
VLNGVRVDINKVEGLKWIKLAADNGSPQANAYLKSLHKSKVQNEINTLYLHLSYSSAI